MLADEQLAILKQINSSIAFDGHDRGAADKLVIEGYVQKDGDHLYQLTPFGRCSTIARRVYRHSRDAPQAPVATENASLLRTLRMQLHHHYRHCAHIALNGFCAHLVSRVH